MYTVYRGQFDCPWCDKAIELLNSKGLSYTVKKLPMGELILKQGELEHPTVPMVLLDGEFIGGYAELEASLHNSA